MEECPICLDFLSEKKNIVKLDCGHLYHYNCIINENINSCPLCREKLSFKGYRLIDNNIV